MADQVFINHQAYEDRHKDRLEAEHLGQTALMRDGSVIGLFDSLVEATEHGIAEYGEGNFSVEVIGAKPIHLGFGALAARSS